MLYRVSASYDKLLTKFRIKLRNVTMCSENKGADQLPSIITKQIFAFVFVYTKSYFFHDEAYLVKDPSFPSQMPLDAKFKLM